MDATAVIHQTQNSNTSLLLGQSVVNLTVGEHFRHRIKKLIIDDDGSFLYIPFAGAIYIAIVFFVLIITFCRHFSKAGDQRMRWIRHSSNGTCLTGPGTMTVVCNNWVYLCRQHGHFGISSGKPTKESKDKKQSEAKVTAKKDELKVEEASTEISATNASSTHSENDQNQHNCPPMVPDSDSTIRRAGSRCFPWTSCQTAQCAISYVELETRPVTPGGNYYCVSGRHTPNDEVIEFWDYTPELERKNGGNGHVRVKFAEMASGGTSGEHETALPGSPNSPSFVPRASLTTPNLSALGRSKTPTQMHGPRRQSKGRRKMSIYDDDPRWTEVMSGYEEAKEAAAQLAAAIEQDENSDGGRERSGSTGSKDGVPARSHSPSKSFNHLFRTLNYISLVRYTTQASIGCSKCSEFIIFFSPTSTARR